jgi:hypothetical protein
MLRRLVRFVLPRTLGLEGLYSGLWIAGLLPTLAARDAATLVLVALRAGVSALELVGAWMLSNNRVSGTPLARGALAASAVLIAAETGGRLAPTNLDPTYRWWIVAAYGIYAAAAIWAAGRVWPPATAE